MNDSFLFDAFVLHVLSPGNTHLMEIMYSSVPCVLKMQPKPKLYIPEDEKNEDHRNGECCQLKTRNFALSDRTVWSIC